MTDRIGHIPKLPKAPLQEVIFELYWNMQYTEHGLKFDPGFDIAQGAFANLIEQEFPIRKKTLPDGVSDHLIYPNPVHRFWKGENTWPVVQIGPGILTVNDTEKNYHWADSFFPLIQSSVKHVLKAYKEKISFNKISLRYIDAVELPSEDLLNFVNSNFQVQINSNFKEPGALNAISINQSFKLADDSLLSISISNGLKNNGKPALIWQSIVQKENNFTEEEVLNWTNNNHSIISDLFKKIIKPEFYGTFL